jgi:GNAT superfamily N-acetyltransferase
MASIRALLMTKVRSRGSKETQAQAKDPVPGQGQTEPGPLDLTATVTDERMHSWESQAPQYPPTGPPGISYFRGELSDELFVDCLLYRDETGELVGILNRYPADFPPHEREGDWNIWVRPDRRRQGIGTALLIELRFRWGPGPNAGDPKVTESGVQFISALEEKYRGSEYDGRAGGWEAWRERRAKEREGPEADWRDVGWEVWHKRRAKEREGPEVPEPSDHNSNA